MTGTELVMFIGACTALLTAAGVFIYQSPGRAWRMLVENLEARVRNLENERTANREELAAAEGEVRRLRTIRSVLEDLLRRAGIDIPVFHPGEHPDIAPERRSPIATVALEVAVEPTKET